MNRDTNPKADATTQRYREIVAQIEARGIMPDRPPGVETVRETVRRLELNIDPSRVVIVAGTNGKGSVCATLEALLLAQGIRTGLYTSPHLVETTERIRIDGQNISRELFIRSFEAVETISGDLGLSHFETLTAMAAWLYFSGEALPPVELVLLEVGLGGLWDATNAIPHSTCVITSLGFDHENLLGASMIDIARNKFGVISPRATVIHSPLPAETGPLVADVKTQTQSQWREAKPYRFLAQPASAPGEDPTFFLETEWGSARLNLPGPRGAANTALALTAFEALGFDPTPHLHILPKVNWPGRMQRLTAPGLPCPVYLSGDHNPQGVESLLELLPFYRWRRIHILAGIGKDKNVDAILEQLSGISDSQLYLTETPFRGRRLAEYGPWIERSDGAWADFRQAWKSICEDAAPEDLILVTGSLYLVGAILGHVTESRDSDQTG